MRDDAPLTFGTAGLRGPMRPGPGGINEQTVQRLAIALVRWLSGDARPVVVGHDARHGSARFAALMGAVLGAAGHDVRRFEEPVPTPLVAFAVPYLGAALGIVVTASHNPAGDNGVKVYLDDGAQLVAPIDGEIAAEMARVDLAPAAPGMDDEVGAGRLVEPELGDAYLGSVVASRLARAPGALRVAYTPMHGVGLRWTERAFAACGWPAPAVVESQAEPDPDFPTVPFPNPEEPGAMDAVLALAATADADLALAHDPDADRLAVAVPERDGWRVLTGDEIGALLGDHVLRHSSGDRVVATTVVSSRLLAAIAAAHGVECIETLTGFKWLARAAPADRIAFAYEEALGYLVNPAVADKDGISAAVAVVDAELELRRRGSTLADRLDELALEHGLHQTRGVSVRLDDESAPRAGELMARWRDDPPSVLGSFHRQGTEDLLAGGRLPATDAVVWWGDGLRVVIRPSGTEPKVKYYLELVTPVASAAELADARDAGAARLDEVVATLG